MKTRSRFKFCFCILHSSFCLSLHAQGTAFTYQGRLNNGVNPASGSYDLRFIVYDNSVGGSQQGPILTNSATAVSNGLFTATLDFGNVFPGAGRFLEIAVRTNGSGGFATLSPRQPLTPAPYAITAGSASNLLGVLPAVQLTGTIQNSSLPSDPIFSGTASASSFSGNGASLTALNATQLASGTVPRARLAGPYDIDITGNAATLGGLTSSGFWRTSGNAGTTAGVQFLGTTDNQALELKVNNMRALRLEPTAINAFHSNIVNVVNGSPLNFVAPGVYGGTIAGGGGYSGSSFSNRVTADFGTVGGGRDNLSSNLDATVGGGDGNTSSGGSATVSGGLGNTSSDYYATVGGGNGNTSSGQQATVGGGNGNTSSGNAATVGGGQGNNSSGAAATVSGGDGNTGSNLYATVGGGFANTSSGIAATVGGGSGNISSNLYATVSGGLHNVGSGAYGTVPGGDQNLAATGAFAAGHRAKANNSGAFVWADSTDTDFASTANDQFNVRANGGVRFVAPVSVNGAVLELKNNSGSPVLLGAINFNDSLNSFAGQINYRVSDAGLHFRTGGSDDRMLLNASGLTVNGTLVSASDRNSKENFSPIDSRSVLEKVVSLPVTEWNYKQDTACKHIGPMAQDFYAAFGVGPDDKHITTIDEGGIALAAIQGLNHKLEQKQTEITELKRKNESLERRLEALEKIFRWQKSN